MKVLIVDDSNFMRKILGNILINAGHEVVAEASNGNEALERYKQYSPDFVTMDITMDYCDGINAAQKIMDYDANAKVIMVSAMGQKVMVLDALKAGAKDFIVKPFKADQIIEAVNHLFLSE